jgi:hypothetical protein
MGDAELDPGEGVLLVNALTAKFKTESTYL